MYFHPLAAGEISDAFAHQQGEHGELLHSGAMHGVVLRAGEGQEVLCQGTYVLAFVLGIKPAFCKMHTGQDMRGGSAAYLRCTFHDVLYATMSATGQEHDVSRPRAQSGSVRRQRHLACPSEVRRADCFPLASGVCPAPLRRVEDQVLSPLAHHRGRQYGERFAEPRPSQCSACRPP